MSENKSESDIGKNAYSFTVTDGMGLPFPLSVFQGRVILCVNVASKCGFTPQYAELEEIYQKYKAQGLFVLAFPCNQFMGQEPGTNAEIHEFCRLTYGVTFQLMNKIKVNGDDADEFYKFLKRAAPGSMGTEFIKWNFTKFLIDRQGQVVKRFGPREKVSDMESDILALLGPAE